MQIVLNNETNNRGSSVTVTKELIYEHRCLAGIAHKNPAFDTRKYKIELEDGTQGRIFANIIMLNLYG